MAKRSDAQLIRVLRAGEKVTLRDIRLMESRSKLGVLRKGHLPTRANNTINMTIEVNQQKKIASVMVQLRLELAYEDSGDGDRPVTIASTYKLRYALVGPIEEKLADHVLQSVAMMNIWPYWRELVQSFTTRMGLPPFPLPLMRPASLLRDTKPTIE